MPLSGVPQIYDEVGQFAWWPMMRSAQAISNAIGIGS